MGNHKKTPLYSPTIEIHCQQEITIFFLKKKNYNHPLPCLQKLAKHLLQINQGITTQIIFLRNTTFHILNNHQNQINKTKNTQKATSQHGHIITLGFINLNHLIYTAYLKIKPKSEKPICINIYSTPHTNKKSILFS